MSPNSPAPPPLVSCIIPCCNAAPWLAETLESTLAQTWPHKEIILVDDGSTDGSLELARGYESRGVRVLRQSHRGAAAARNAGLAAARGDYLQFLDADDLLSVDKISAQLAILREASAGSVASCRWGRFQNDPTTAVFSDTTVFHDFAPAREFLVHQAGTGDMMHPAAWLTPRATAEAAGPWNETLSLNDDGEYFCRVLLRTDAVRFSPEGSVHYRSALPGSLSRRRSKTAMQSLMRSMELYAGHLLATEYSPRVRAALANLWQRACFELYPDAPDLSTEAGRRALSFGRPTVVFPFGPKLRWIAALLGWKLTRRLQRWRQR
jgi:glycosyltransferase involved in cell wall biosynthesis